MAEAPLKIAVVGHTNTGKTSLLRTLTRDPSFGQVADAPGTTRHVEGVRLAAGHDAIVEWYDTPGMEDSIALLEYLDRLDEPGARLDGPARVRRLLDSPEARGRFEQEARVLAKLLDCDAALYVIDARDPVLGKHRDELSLLAACGRPLLPVLNFVQAPAHRAQAWRDAMARLGLHAVLEFDTVAPPLDGEQRLYGRLGMLLHSHSATLERIADALGQQRSQRRIDACRVAADLLIDAAALRLTVANDADALAAATETLREQVRLREQAAAQALLALYNFRPGDYASDALPLSGERWNMDLFHPHALKDMGVRLGMGAAAGAMAGGAVDLAVGGLSFGAGMLIGAAAGGLWQGVGQLGQRIAGRLRGHRELSVDDAVLRLLALRQRQLIQALERRGHAAREPLRLDQPADDAWRKAPLPDALAEARSRPAWSALNAHHDDDDRRKQKVAELAQRLAQGMETGAPTE
ncbi:GTPase/DUF3482 domain-containing protein [Bordetella genomosp. 13]|uniref:GTPase SAR1 n=1 Tax=Bordetella genomosp. 13 TaxID=463040 RepID=A0A1W6Z6P5_9BORD|nr:GTPase/DUF3482 domain-containing protein [Bordetella genomosp. 13]ARP93029.1 GTPase SAR1 [Bordetella genomosp. 13]